MHCFKHVFAWILQANIQENYKNIEKTLQKANEKKRASLIKKFSLDSAFDESGTMKSEFATKLGLTESAEQVDTQSQEPSSIRLASLLKKEYYSPSLRGNEAEVETDLTQMTEQLRADETKLAQEEGRQAREISEIKPFTGELTEKGKRNYSKTKRALNALNNRGGKNISLVVIEPNDYINANIVDDRTIYIGADVFENDTWAGAVVHEYTHFAEGTKEYVKLIDYLQKDVKLFSDAFNSFVKRGYASGEMINSINEKFARGETLTEQEQTYKDNLINSRTFRSEMGAIMSEQLLGSETFIDKIVTQEKSIAEKVMKKIQDLKSMFERLGNAEAMAEYKRLTKAEKLYLEAIEKAGYKYRNGKIIIRKDKDVDETSQAEYNNNEIQSLRKDNLIGQTFPTYNESFSEANQIATRWAKQKNVKDGWQKLVSFKDKWYKIEKFSDMDLGYLIVAEIPNSKYNVELEELRKYEQNDYADSLDQGLSEYENVRRNKSIDSTIFDNGHSDRDIPTVAQNRDSGKEDTIYGRRNSGQSNGNKQRNKINSLSNYSRGNASQNSKTKKQVKYLPYDSVGQNAIREIRSQLSKMYDGISDGVADGIAIENGNIVYIVDSGKENGDIRFGIRHKLEISDSKLRAEYIRRTNNESIRKGYISDELSSKLGDRYDNNRTSNRGQELGKELSVNKEQPQNNKGRISSEDANRRGEVKFSLKENAEQEVLDYYGKTSNWKEVVYLFKDGTRLDGSGRAEGASGGYRTVDHRDIFNVLTDNDTLRVDGMVEFMSRGNIRVMPELPGINLQVEPTEAQYKAIQDFVERVGFNEEYFSVDFDNAKGDVIDSLEYEGKVSGRKVVADIKHYFKEGSLPYRSEISKFRYSRKESQYYYQLSKGQIKKMFADHTGYKVYSKVDAEQIINNVLSNYMSFGDKYGEISGKNKKQVIDMLWQGLNTAKPGKQASVALNIADYIIQNSVLENVYVGMYDGEMQSSLDIIDALKPYLHKIDLSSIKGEISHRYDADNSPYLLWGKGKGRCLNFYFRSNN